MQEKRCCGAPFRLKRGTISHFWLHLNQPMASFHWLWGVARSSTCSTMRAFHSANYSSSHPRSSILQLDPTNQLKSNFLEWISEERKERGEGRPRTETEPQVSHQSGRFRRWSDLMGQRKGSCWLFKKQTIDLQPVMQQQSILNHFFTFAEMPFFVSDGIALKTTRKWARTSHLVNAFPQSLNLPLASSFHIPSWGGRTGGFLYEPTLFNQASQADRPRLTIFCSDGFRVCSIFSTPQATLARKSTDDLL